MVKIFQTSDIYFLIYKQMGKVLNFKGFLNEGAFGSLSAFVFVPVDKNFKSLDTDIPNSKLLLPSQRSNAGVAGYLIVPATVETNELMKSPYMMGPKYGVSGNMRYTKSPANDGIIIMNGGDEFTTGAATGVASITAKVPGFGQNAGYYFKSGNALILEELMKKEGWDEENIDDIKGRKIGNGFSPNKTLTYLAFGGIEEAAKLIKELFAASSEDIGLKFEDPEIAKNYDSTELLLKMFTKNPSGFVELNFSEGTFEKISSLAKETGTEEVAKTIDNLSDLKSAGFFED
jgi:hypothetical protein